jgi:dTDP-4-amino-4,6-dideoxygalactose transaminase
MTTLQKIIKDAKILRTKSPKKYSKWTDYVKEASKKYSSKNPVTKNKATMKKNKIKVVSGVKKKKIVKKAVKKSPTLTKVKEILKHDHKRLKHGYNLTNGSVRIGACSRMSLQHYQDICNKIEEVKENIMFLIQEINDKKRSLNYRNNSKKDLIEDKKYLKELKTQKTEIKKLL